MPFLKRNHLLWLLVCTCFTVAPVILHSQESAVPGPSGLFSGTVLTSIINLSWHTAKERSAKNIEAISGDVSRIFLPSSKGIDVTKNFLIFLAGAYAIEDSHVAEYLLNWMPESVRKTIADKDVGNRDCTVIPLVNDNGQAYYIVVENFLRADDEQEKLCFLFGLRYAFKLPTLDIGKLTSEQALAMTIGDLQNQADHLR